MGLRESLHRVAGIATHASGYFAREIALCWRQRRSSMKKILLVAVVLLAGCSAKTEKQSVSLVLDADFTSGKLVLTCRDSSSGTCHVLVAGNGQPVRISAPKGGTGEATGAAEGAQYCVGSSAPESGCQLHPLKQGEQIFRASEIKTESR
jgi:hypothetical protein